MPRMCRMRRPLSRTQHTLSLRICEEPQAAVQATAHRAHKQGEAPAAQGKVAAVVAEAHSE